MLAPLLEHATVEGAAVAESTLSFKDDAAAAADRDTGDLDARTAALEADMSPALNGAGGIRDEVNANEEQHLDTIRQTQQEIAANGAELQDYAMTQTHASQSEFAKKIKELTDGIQKERSDEENTLENAIDAEENKQQRARSDNQQSIRLTQKKLQAAQKRTGELGQQWAVKEQANLQLATELGKKQNEADAEDAKVAADVKARLADEAKAEVAAAKRSLQAAIAKATQPLAGLDNARTWEIERRK